MLGACTTRKDNLGWDGIGLSQCHLWLSEIDADWERPDDEHEGKGDE